MGKSRNGLSGGEYGSGDAMSPHEEASKMLEAALIEMDGIIAGTVRGDFDHPGPPPSPFLSIHQAAERLKLAIQQHQLVSGALEENGNDFDGNDSDEREETNNGRNNNFDRRSRGASAGANVSAAIDSETRQLLLAWLTSASPGSGTSGTLELEARAQKLEGDKNSLQFQVSCLQDQVDSQQQKIRELERTLDSKRAQLLETEEALNRELTQRSNLEAHKLDLMTEIGNLRIKMSRLERENLDVKEKLRAAEITSLKFSSGTTPSTGTEQAGTNSPRFRDQHQFLSLPRPGKDSGPRTAGDSVDTAGAAVPDPNLSSRPPVPPRSNPPATQASSSNVNGGADTNGNDTDWPPKDLPVRRPTTPTLDRTRERVIHSCSPSRSLSDAGAAKHKHKGLRNIFSKMKKSSSATPATASGNGDVARPMMISSELQRGGIRATAGPRLGWSKGAPHGPDLLQMSTERPSKWNTESICLWLGELGLGAYVPAARNWMQTGEILLSASSSDLEKHLGVRNLLHRKKILLGIDRLRRLDRADPGSFSGRPGRLWKDLSVIEEDPSARLDTASILRWLSDVGLGQYRESFTECRVDGPMLDNLTLEEATHWLKITNFVHFLGLRSGIKVLREVEFDLTKLIRTPAEDVKNGEQEQDLNDSGEGVCFSNVESLGRWTNARLMEWLRCIDLAEFAVNLNGSGVHGGLLVSEDRFNAEALATVLSIPSGKTLLRRHLSLQFAALVGKSVLQAKRDAEMSKGASPLSPTTKIKLHKPQFGLIKKKHKFGEFDPHDLVCPPTSSNGSHDNNSSPRASPGPRSNSFQGSSVVTSNDLPETTIE